MHVFYPFGFQRQWMYEQKNCIRWFSQREAVSKFRRILFSAVARYGTYVLQKQNQPQIKIKKNWHSFVVVSVAFGINLQIVPLDSNKKNWNKKKKISLRVLPIALFYSNELYVYTVHVERDDKKTTTDRIDILFIDWLMWLSLNDYN